MQEIYYSLIEEILKKKYLSMNLLEILSDSLTSASKLSDNKFDDIRIHELDEEVQKRLDELTEKE